MPLSVGSRVGEHEIVGELGAGGMGEVYRARDTTLNREVALKVLPESLAADAGRLARFDREAKALAALNHPNIAQVFRFEQSEDVKAIVMELVEGPTLEERLRGGPLTLDETLSIARQLVEALDAAHRAGIVHRDLKPANVKVREDGTVKVLDFGLAKALDPSHEASGSGASPEVSPTLSTAMTAAGMLIGTAAYMAPEQAKGRPADKRADVWAFGVLLHEMLTGRRLFEGETISDVLAAVLRDELDFGTLPPSTPLALRRLLRRCLERDPKLRLRDVADARADLREAEEGGPVELAAAAPSAARWRAAALLLGALALVAAAAALWPGRGEGSASHGVTRLSIALPPGHALTSGPAISPDGRTVAFAATDGSERPRLFLRRLDEQQSRRVEDSEDAQVPFFSPDGQWVAFYTNDALYKLRLDGGAPVRIASSGSNNGGAWLDDGRIVFSRAWNGGLLAKPATGGPVEPLVVPQAPLEYACVWPLAMPGSRELLFCRWGESFGLERLDLATGERQQLVPGAWRTTRYTTTGHLLMAHRNRELWAVPYEAALRGEGWKSAFAVAEGIDAGGQDGQARFDVSRTGTLVYSPRDRRRQSIAEVDSQGRVLSTVYAEAGAVALALSPSARTLVLKTSSKLMALDVERGTAVPFVPELDSLSGARSAPLWSADGSRVLFASNHEGNWDIYSRDASGVGPIAGVLERPLDQNPLSVAPDGTLLFRESHPETGADLWLLPPGGEPEPWLVTDKQEGDARFSPDGRLVAFVSNLTGRDELYLQEREPGGPRLQLSTGSASTPRWSPDGRRLYFRQARALMVVDVGPGEELTAGVPRLLFDGGWRLGADSAFEILPSGSFLMVESAPEAIADRIDVVLNWFDELERRSPED